MRSRVPRPSRAPTLMLTPLLDMFTIILIFLIVSFEAEDYGFKLSSEVALPESSSRAELKPAVNVVITEGHVLLSDRPVVGLTEGKVADAYHQAGQIAPLVDALKKEYKKRYGEQGFGGARVGTDDEGQPEGPILVLQADRQLDYRTLYIILRSAANAGFFKYRLAVLKS